MKTVEQRLADLEAAVFDKHNETRVPMVEVPWDEWCAQPCACGHPRMEHTGKNGDGSCNGAGRPCGCERFVMKPPQPAPSGAWEAAIAWLTEKIDFLGARQDANDLSTFGDGKLEGLVAARAHFRTLSAPGGGDGDGTKLLHCEEKRCSVPPTRHFCAGCFARHVAAPGAGGVEKEPCGRCEGAGETVLGGCSACGGLGTQEAAIVIADMVGEKVATRDAEIARLAAMVEQMVTRDHVGECVEAAVAEERARSEAFYGDALALGAVIASMRPVVDAAVEWWADTPRAVPILLEAIKTYQHKKPHHE